LEERLAAIEERDTNEIATRRRTVA